MDGYDKFKQQGREEERKRCLSIIANATNWGERRLSWTQYKELSRQIMDEKLWP